MSLPDNRPESAESLQAHIHLVCIPAGIQPPNIDLVMAAQVQETFRGIAFHPDFYIPVNIAND